MGLISDRFGMLVSLCIIGFCMVGFRCIGKI